MMKLIAALVLSAAVCPAGTFLYSNASTDLLNTAVYGGNGYSEIGDQVHLVSPAWLTDLTVQFYAIGADATFDAVLRFYNVGSPVGSQIGGAFTLAGISIGAGLSQDVTFSNLGFLLVPQDLIATLSVENVTGGGDVGINLFDPPTVGTSSNGFFFANDGTGLAQVSSETNMDNLYLVIGGESTPEPAVEGITFAGLMLLVWYRQKRR